MSGRPGSGRGNRRRRNGCCPYRMGVLLLRLMLGLMLGLMLRLMLRLVLGVGLRR